MENGTCTLDSQKLRRIREQQKLTQLFLATSVEVTTETISRWENKKYPTIKRENAEKLAEVLNVSLTDLLKDSSPAPPLPENEPTPLPSTIPWDKVARWSKHPPLVALILGLGTLLFFVLARMWIQSVPTSPFVASRYIPSCVLPGQIFPVLVRIESGSTLHPLMLREQLPDHSELIASLPACMNAGHSTHQLKWMLTSQSTGTRTITYLVQPALHDMGHSLEITGNLVTGPRGSKETEVQGMEETKIAPYHWADENQDHRIDDYEMLSVYDLFPNGEQLGIDLTEIKAIWAGEGYQWDPQQRRILILPHGGNMRHSDNRH